MNPTRTVPETELQHGDQIGSGNPLEPWTFLHGQWEGDVWHSTWSAPDRDGGVAELYSDGTGTREVLGL